MKYAKMDSKLVGIKGYAEDYIQTIRVEQRKFRLQSTIIVENIDELISLYAKKYNTKLNISQMIDWLVHKEKNRIDYEEG